VATALAACTTAGDASAHAYLVRTVPASGAVVHGSPRTIALVFDESVSSDLSRITLVGARTGRVARLRILPRHGSTLLVSVPRLPRDLYRLEWHVVSEDDLHATGGTLLFGVDTAVPLSQPDGGTRSPGASPVEVGLRWADFAAIAVVIGALATLLSVVPAAARRGARRLEVVRDHLLRLGIACAVAALVTGTSLLLLQLDRAGGIGQVGRVLGRTTYGHAWIARQAILLVLACLLATSRPRPDARATRVVAATLAGGLVVPLALVSHAAAIKGEASVATAVLAVHLLAAALWVGGVVALCLATAVLVRRGERASARTLALAFGEPAVVTVALLAITGLAVLGIHVHSFDALAGTGYGQTVIAKSALFLLAGAIGLATTLGLRVGRAPRRLRAAWMWAPQLESAALVGVLLAAAVLTASAPARRSAVRAPTPRPAVTPTTSVANVRDLVVSLAVEPNRPGTNFVTVHVYDTRRPPPAPIGRVALTVTPDGRPLQRLTLAPAGADEWQAATRLAPGSARMAVEIERPGLRVASATTALNVSSPRPGPTASRPSTGSASLGERPLEPLLEPVAIAGAVLLLVALILRLWRTSSVSAVAPRRAERRAPRDLQPGKVER
jgi:copper transport protein